MSARPFTAAGWVRDAEGRLKREKVAHMGRRLPGFDYRRKGYYVITLVLADRRLGRLGELKIKRPPACAEGAQGTGRPGVTAGGSGVTAGEALWLSVDEARALDLKPEKIEAKVEFSALGRAVFNHFRRIGEFTPGLRPVFCAVMPDHLHLILEIVEELKRPLGNAIAGFKTGCEKIYQGQGGEGRLFAEGFVDEICLRAGQLAAEFDYLNDNPRRLAVKRLFPWLFKVSREIRVAFRLAKECPAGVSSAPAEQSDGRFSAVGNHFLLSRAELVQVQVSRRFFAYARDERGRLLKEATPVVSTPEFAEKLAAALAAAKRGAVVVSPCVSQGEREIARQVFAAGGRVITLQNKGFSPLYKPGGRLFETCAKGNLLMLAPIGWPYEPAEKPMTRLCAQVLNRIAQLIAGAGAAEIDYNGVTIANVDADVRAVL